MLLVYLSFEVGHPKIHRWFLFIYLNVLEKYVALKEMGLGFFYLTTASLYSVAVRKNKLYRNKIIPYSVRFFINFLVRLVEIR